MNHFKNCLTLDEAKNLFKDLCKKLHPDTSGYNSQSDFIQMYNEFKAFKPSIKKDTDNFNVDDFYNILKCFETLDGVNINFVGSFIWLDGDTQRHKDKIKTLILEGYNVARWANIKKKWYFAPSDYKGSKSKGKDYNEIISKYGVKSVNINTTKLN